MAGVAIPAWCGGRSSHSCLVSTNLVSGDSSHRSDIFVHDRTTGYTTRVSVVGDDEEETGEASFRNQRRRPPHRDPSEFDKLPGGNRRCCLGDICAQSAYERDNPNRPRTVGNLDGDNQRRFHSRLLGTCYQQQQQYVTFVEEARFSIVTQTGDIQERQV